MMHRTGRSWKVWGMGLAIAVMVVSIGLPAWAGKADDTLNIAWQKELPTLDRYYNTAREGMIISRHICDDLLYRDPKTNAYEPLLAKSYKWVDPTTLDFTLRRGIVFHDGEKFSADDVVFTLNYMSNPANKVLVQRNVDWIDHVEKLGPYKVRIHLKKPFPAALEYVAGNLPIYPHRYYAKVGPKGFGLKPIGTGPYKVVEVDPGKKIVMVKNTHYFKASPKGQPAIGRIVQRTIPELTTIMAELVTGDLDWAYLIPKDQAEKLATVPTLKVLRAETMRIGFLEMDAKGRSGDTPFRKLAVRRAVNYAIDRNAIARGLVGGQSRAVYSACYPTQFGCTQDVMKYEYNPAKAKKLLAEAGYPNGFDTVLYGYRNPSYAEAIAGYLQAVGIRAKLSILKYSTLDKKIYANKVPLVFMTWGSYGINDVSAITDHFFNEDAVDFAGDAKVKQWLAEGDNSVDPNVRKAAYAKALNRIADQAYWAPMFTYVANYAFTKDLHFEAQPDAVPRFFLAHWN